MTRLLVYLLSIFVLYVSRYILKHFIPDLQPKDPAGSAFEKAAFHYVDLPAVFCFLLLLLIYVFSDRIDWLQGFTARIDQKPTAQIRNVFTSGAIFFHLVVTSIISLLSVARILSPADQPPREVV